MEHKAGQTSQVKIVSEDKGQVQAVFSTLNVVDHDGDVTRPGAFGEQKVRISAYNHRSWQDAMPVGKGTIQERGNEAILDGQFFMDTTAGKETFLTVKGLGDMMEWSYGYDVLEKADGMWPEGDPNGQQVRFLDKLKVYEASPVLLGAGLNTRTLAAKSADKGAIPYSSSGTTDTSWDAGAMWANCPTQRAALRAASAWVDSSGNPDAKASYKFIHHMVGSNGAVGTANTVACSTGIGVLNGGRGGTVIPDGDRQGVYNHLAHHLRDAGKEPPPLKSREEIETNGVSLYDQLAWSVHALDDVYTRVAEAVAMRAEKGEKLADPTQEMIGQLLSNSERLREALAIEPREDPKHDEYLQQLRKQAEALLYLTNERS